MPRIDRVSVQLHHVCSIQSKPTRTRQSPCSLARDVNHLLIRVTGLDDPSSYSSTVQIGTVTFMNLPGFPRESDRHLDLKSHSPGCFHSVASPSSPATCVSKACSTRLSSLLYVRLMLRWPESDETRTRRVLASSQQECSDHCHPLCCIRLCNHHSSASTSKLSRSDHVSVANLEMRQNTGIVASSCSADLYR